MGLSMGRPPCPLTLLPACKGGSILPAGRRFIAEFTTERDEELGISPGATATPVGSQESRCMAYKQSMTCPRTFAHHFLAGYNLGEFQVYDLLKDGIDEALAKYRARKRSKMGAASTAPSTACDSPPVSSGLGALETGRRLPRASGRRPLRLRPHGNAIVAARAARLQSDS